MKKTTIQLAVMLLCAGNLAMAQEAQVPATAPAPAAANPDEIQKVFIVSTGSRGSQRSSIDTPVPIDVIGAKDLGKTGQVSLDKALQFRVPSFNTVQTPVNDATSLLDPYEIRNMGPSRALILINGKRKNSSALIYTQTSPGRGESGADISAIPVDAIKRMEVVRDGASAQYGSDAIAGVVNIILKDNASGGSVTARAGMTHEEDGKMGGLSLNHGVALGDRGFVNYTVDVSKVGLARRSGLVNAQGEANDFGASLADVNKFLAVYPDAGNINGSPETKATKALVNARYDVADGVSLYGNAAYIQKKVNSYANYRTPYWRPTDYGLLHASGTPYMGYVPDFIGNLDDYNGTFGTKLNLNDWNADFSLTFGGNKQTYDVKNSVNRGIEDQRIADIAAGKTPGPRSPTQFYAGGTKFNHIVFNGDIDKQVTDTVSVFFGTEGRKEKYQILVGDFASYTAGGADSYAGNSPENALSETRTNYGVYGGAKFDITKELLLDATGRYEHYSDFGNAFVWKLASSYKVSNELVLRASLSTGFRAPSLHQIYTQKAQYSFVPGSGIQVSGLANNVSAQARALQVPLLKPEKSDNLTLGVGFKPTSDTSITLDYYNIRLKDRIILGKEIAPSGNPAAALDIELKKANVVSMSFFVNGVDTKTSGLDYVYSTRNIPLAGGKMTVNLSGNYTLENERDGAVKNPKLVADAKQSVLDATQEALMFTSRPKFKNILGADLDYEKVNFSLNATTFGPTKFRNAGMDSNLGIKFKTKTVVDFGLNYNLAKNVTLGFNVNNMFNTVPKWDFETVNDKAKGQAILNDPAARQNQVNLITFNGRYDIVTYDGSHFSQLGRMYAANLNFRF